MLLVNPAPARWRVLPVARAFRSPLLRGSDDEPARRRTVQRAATLNRAAPFDKAGSDNDQMNGFNPASRQ